LEKLSKYFKDWRIIEWRIPATEEGLYSMKIALEFGFKVIGYDIGSYPNKNDTLNDCIVTAYFPRGIKFTQYEQMNIQRETIPLVNQVLDSLGIRYRVRKK
jgi:hypothetical protein